MLNTKALYIVMLLLTFISCESSQDDVLNSVMSNVEQQDVVTRTLSEDSISNVLIPLIATSEQLEMQNRQNHSKRMNAPVPLTPYTEYDEDYFLSNIYAIRELPVSITVQNVAEGADGNKKYWYCQDVGQEVTLGNPYPSRRTTRRSNAFDFYIKTMPPSSGIEYLIYSYRTNTPLTIGHYDNAPDVKILMSQKDNSSLSDFVGWDLIPSTRYKGYFGIQNSLYFGQSNPDNMHTVFNYAVEALQNDKLGFAKPEEDKAQQNFLITPYANFKLTSLEYDLDNVYISSQLEFHDGTGENLSLQEKAVDVQFNFKVLENSYYNMNNNTLKINVADTIIPCPRVTGKAIMLPNAENAHLHTFVPFESPNIVTKGKNISYKMLLNCPAKTNIRVRAYFVKYNVSTKFKAKAQFKDRNNDIREVIITGTWTALLYENPSIIKPKYDDPVYTSFEDTDEPIIIRDFRPIILDSIPRIILK